MIERLLEFKLPYEEETLLGKDRQAITLYMRGLVKELQRIYDQVVQIVNLSLDLMDGEALYLASKDQNGAYPEGTWRFIVVAGEIQLQNLVSSTWTLFHKWSKTEFQFSNKISDKNSAFKVVAGLITGATNALWDAAAASIAAHIISTGEDHTFIDQSVISGSRPNFVNTNMSGLVSIWDNDAGYDVTSHRHDGHTLEMDGVSSDGGAFTFQTADQVTFNQKVKTAKTMECKRFVAGGITE